MTSKKTGQLTEKTWGRGWVVLVVSTKWRKAGGGGGGEEGGGGGGGVCTQATKYIARKSRIQLHGRHLLFGEYL